MFKYHKTLLVAAGISGYSLHVGITKIELKRVSLESEVLKYYQAKKQQISSEALLSATEASAEVATQLIIILCIAYTLTFTLKLAAPLLLLCVFSFKFFQRKVGDLVCPLQLIDSVYTIQIGNWESHIFLYTCLE